MKTSVLREGGVGGGGWKEERGVEGGVGVRVVGGGEQKVIYNYYTQQTSISV